MNEERLENTRTFCLDVHTTLYLSLPREYFLSLSLKRNRERERNIERKRETKREGERE
jgi:hypothetical protein